MKSAESTKLDILIEEVEYIKKENRKLKSLISALLFLAIVAIIKTHIFRWKAKSAIYHSAHCI